MTRFIVHIGDGKCGSSSIQSSLFAARTSLRQVGLLFETTTPSIGHFNLGSLVGKKTRGEAEPTAESARSTVRMIREAVRPGDTVLLSAESFFNASPGRTIDLLRTISPQIEHLDVIAYVRAPHSMYLSLTQQRLKGDSRFTPPESYRRRIDLLLDAWNSCAEVGSLTVRNFDRTRLIGGDVINDFEHCLRRASGQSVLHLPRSNENATLSAEQLIVLQRYRRIVLKAHDGKLHPASQALIRYFERLDTLGFPGSKPALTDAALASLCDANRQIVDATNARFPGLELGLPVVSETPPADSDAAPSESVERILADVDPQILAVLLSLVPGLEAETADRSVGSVARHLQEAAMRHGIDATRLVAATVRFWREVNCPDRAASLERNAPVAGRRARERARRTGV
ncbi:MAG: hypothetical protein WA989_00760 [Henriciella sp.]|uniref:hypothetical protein n=1 Tax=Henriciella sp. TaxID=1968823 RepID=UPI003C73F638